ncbi:hypothetical protein EXA67_13465 [Salmonella enterica subsp. enterica serovar Stanley]|nr:hypothetical protein [Salmonella enterica subsp. enterica serovar Stanley]
MFIRFVWGLYVRKNLDILLRVVTTPHRLNPPLCGFCRFCIMENFLPVQFGLLNMVCFKYVLCTLN